MKKKNLLLVLFVILALSSVACGKVDEQTQEVISIIDNIGDVDFDDEVLIVKAENAYYSLSEKQQKKVKNKKVLFEDRQLLDELLASRPVPFSNANWDTNADELEEIHGSKPSDTYDDSYGGKCYVFNNVVYDGKTGLIRYFYDGNDKLAEMRFDASFNGESETRKFYDTYADDFSDKYGEIGYSLDEGGVRGDVWYREEGNIGLTMSTFLCYEVFISYVSADASTKSNN